MSRKVDYKTQTIDNPNPIARLAHRTRFARALELLDESTPPNGTVLDFGAGPGELLHRLSLRRRDISLIAHEPYMEVRYEGIAHLKMDDVEANSVDVLCSFETFEHLSAEYMEYFFHQSHRVCKPGARIVISVPIMVGLALPVKELSRSLLFRRWSDYGTVELLRGTLGLEVGRARDILASHKGFDFRALSSELTSRYRKQNVSFSPFTVLPWWLNSQAFFVLETNLK